MNIKFIDNLSFNVYIKKEELKDINIKNKEEVEKYLKQLIKRIMKIYKIIIEGFYDVNIYIDKYYGIMINFNKERLEYYDYFNGQVEMNINLKEISFLYEVNDIPIKLLNKLETIKIDNNLYLKIIKELNQKEFMNLIEHTEKIIKI